VALQETLLPGRGVPSAVSVAVRVWCSPGWRVKLGGETLREVGRPTEGPEYVPDEGSLTVSAQSLASKK
jgi:hypothetical protein